MKTAYIEHLNPPFADECTREALASNGSLGKAILDNCLSNGQYVVYAPPGLQLDDKRNYGYSGNISGTAALGYLEKMLMDTAQKSDKAVLLVYDNLMKPADAPVSRFAAAKRATFGNELYYLIAPTELGGVVARAVLGWAWVEWLSFGGALGFAKWAQTSPEEPLILQQDDIDEFSRSVNLFYLNAFDGEGHIIWKRKSLSP